METPFKGIIYWEWQIGPLVFQWRHTPGKNDCWETPNWKANPYDGSRQIRAGRALVWTDPYWR